MKLSTLISHSSELIRIILKSYQPSDRIASQYFRKKKYIGSKERRFISEITFSTLRNLLLSQFAFPNVSYDDDKIKVIINLILNNYFHIDKSIDLKNLFKRLPNYSTVEFNIELSDAIGELLGISTHEVERVINLIKGKFSDLLNQIDGLKSKADLNEKEINIIASRYSMPVWILEELHNNKFTKRTWQDIIDVAQSLTSSAPLTIRVNLNIANRDDILKYLNDNGIDSYPTTLSPAGIIIKKRYQLTQLDIYKNGLFEIQDEGSQLVSYALSPTKNSQILDAAAGAGGKTLHLACITDGKASITASDIEGRRLKELSKRLKRYNDKSINIKFINPKFFTDDTLNQKNIFPTQFDFILIDAPCSGMGTVRRMPMQKYRVNKKLLQKLQNNQFNILNFYAQYLKPKGILVYATCSIMPDENEYLIEKFLNNNQDFKPDFLLPAFQQNNILIPNLSENDYFISLSPSIHKTDGFFIARLKRQG